jgi:hypothetical protein
MILSLNGYMRLLNPLKLVSKTSPQDSQTLQQTRTNKQSDLVDWDFDCTKRQTHGWLLRAKFGTKKAWNVATRLGKRIFEEIATPRNGVSNSFEAGNNKQVCQKVFWAVVRSHDVMAWYKRNRFKDNPTVSAEVVKFMAINTGFEALDTLVIKVESMEADVKASKQEAMAANKAASSAANKLDTMKKTINMLVKRISKLEE